MEPCQETLDDPLCHDLDTAEARYFCGVEQV